MAYGATEPEAGSDLGRAARPPRSRSTRTGGRRLPAERAASSGSRNGGVADVYTDPGHGARRADAGSSSSRAPTGFTHGKPEDKHGIRLSNTAPLFLEDVDVDADRLVGGVEGQGLVQAQQVFGYTRLMVAAFGLGAGWAALDRAIPYSTERIQAGGPLSEKQGYTHKLIVPHAVRLEAARAYIEETADRLDAGEGTLNTEGAIAKYLATEAGNAAADAAIQAHGGYGYTHEYMVEKIKRDVRITTHLRGHLGDHGDDDRPRPLAAAPQDARRATTTTGARELEALAGHDADVGRRHRGARAPRAGRGARGLPRRPRSPATSTCCFRLGELVARAEGAAALARRAAPRGAAASCRRRSDTPLRRRRAGRHQPRASPARRR